MHNCGICQNPPTRENSTYTRSDLAPVSPSCLSVPSTSVWTGPRLRIDEFWVSSVRGGDHNNLCPLDLDLAVRSAVLPGHGDTIERTWTGCGSATFGSIALPREEIHSDPRIRYSHSVNWTSTPLTQDISVREGVLTDLVDLEGSPAVSRDGVEGLCAFQIAT